VDRFDLNSLLLVLSFGEIGVLTLTLLAVPAIYVWNPLSEIPENL
jgi:hypothetical protein